MIPSKYLKRSFHKINPPNKGQSQIHLKNKLYFLNILFRAVEKFHDKISKIDSIVHFNTTKTDREVIFNNSNI